MTATALRTLGILALLTTQACILGKRGGPPELTTPPSLHTNGKRGRDAKGGFGPKSVEGKEPPTRLIARDGSSCVVTKKKFDSTVLGTSAWCTWFHDR